MDLDLKEIIDDIRDIAVEAGETVMEVYKDMHDDDVEMKSDDSPLTIADKRSNDVITKRLNDLGYDIPIISEENRNAPWEERKNYHYAWMIDPLDGTKEFIKENDEFTVNIALLKDGSPILGVVYAPVFKEEYWATKDGKAYKRPHKRRRRRIKVSEFQMDDKALRVVCSRSHMNAETSEFMGELKKPKPVYCGSSLKFISIAKGEAELYPRIAPTMEWDTAAAQIIVEEAGGVVEAYASKEPLVYNKENFLNPYFIARGRIVEE